MKILKIVKPKNKSQELKPCPFCGGEEVVYIQYQHPVGKRWAVSCSDCIAGIDPGYAQQPYEVQEMWNSRV